MKVVWIFLSAFSALALGTHGQLQLVLNPSGLVTEVAFPWPAHIYIEKTTNGETPLTCLPNHENDRGRVALVALGKGSVVTRLFFPGLSGNTTLGERFIFVEGENGNFFWEPTEKDPILYDAKGDLILEWDLSKKMWVGVVNDSHYLVLSESLQQFVTDLRVDLDSVKAGQSQLNSRLLTSLEQQALSPNEKIYYQELLGYRLAIEEKASQGKTLRPSYTEGEIIATPSPQLHYRWIYDPITPNSIFNVRPVITSQPPGFPNFEEAFMIPGRR